MPASVPRWLPPFFALQAYLPDHVINFLGGRDGVNMLGNMVSSVKDIIAGGNTNMRRTPGVREEKTEKILMEMIKTE